VKEVDQGAALNAVDGRWSVVGALNMDTVAAVLDTSASTALPPTGVIDLRGVTSVDSAGVALLLAWKRRALAEAKAVVFADVPANLASLAQLYDVVPLVTD
jgi:phospholipid transport system transporter-binding protein